MISEETMLFTTKQLEKGMLPKDCVIKLKELGISQKNSVWALNKVYNLSLPEADKIVLFVDCWKEKLNSTLNFRHTFWNVVEKYSEEE